MRASADRWSAEHCLPGIPSKRPVGIWAIDGRRILPWALLAISCIFNLFLLVKLGLPQVELMNEPALSGLLSDVRNLVETNSGNSTLASSGSTSSAHDGHQYDALLFLFNSLVIGTAVTHLTTMPAFSGLQHTVVVFVLGVLYSLIQEGLGVKEDTGVFGHSYDMWMHIDPHLLLFALLPPLLAGDAMAIDTQIAKRVANQCLYLAGPGVVMSAMLTAGFFMLFLDWSFLLSLCTGSILCATDPVAVVALLKDLGASPTLTVQIQGESLLNDGTAIVLFSVSYSMLKGDDLDASDIVMYLIKTALMAFALGLCIGYVFFMWIRKASNRLDHRSSIIQISLTLCCAYWSFILAEGVLHISGVLATVAASLTLADRMWPHIVSQEAMHHVWHTFEALGNTIIFFLAGALTGNAMLQIDGIDYLNLIVIYIVLTFIRGTLLLTSRPLLKRLSSDGTDVTKASAIVMTWGGLRGAVGLALAIQVKLNRAADDDGVEQISSKDADRVLFFVGGIAFLTLVVNASTCPILVRALGISSTPEAKKRILRMIHRQLVRHTKAKNYPKEVTDSLDRILLETVDHIEHENSWSAKNSQKSASSKEDLFVSQTNSDGTVTKTASLTKAHSKELDRAAGLFSIPVDETNSVKPWSQSMPNPVWGLPCAVADEEEMYVSNAEGASVTDSKNDHDVSTLMKPPEPMPDPASPSSSVNGDLQVICSGNADTAPVTISVVPPMPISGTPSKERTSARERQSGRLSSKIQASMNSMAELVSRSLSVRREANLHQDEATKLVDDLQYCRNEFGKIPEEDLSLLGELPEMFLRPFEHKLAKLVMSHAQDVDGEMQEAINGAYLSLVQSQYWKFIEQRDLIPGTKEADVLLISIQVSRSKSRTHLVDWGQIVPHLDVQVRRGSLEDRGYRSELSNTSGGLDVESLGWRNRLIKLLESAPIQTAVAGAIVLNGIYIAIEDNKRKGSNEDDLAWLVIEICFTFVFTLEFIVSFTARGMDYFRSGWNIFDFILVVLGVFGIISSFVARGLDDVSGNADVSGEARLVRVARVFRVMRLLRLFRLVKFFQVMQAKLQRQEMSLEVAEHMQTMAILIGFIRAHLLSQQQFFRLLCGEEDQFRVCSVEVARCMLQSQLGVYRAMRFAVARSGKLDKQNLTQVNNVKESKRITEELEHFILSAWETGVISAREAESVLHPLHDHIKQCMVLIKDSVRGVSRDLKEELVEGRRRKSLMGGVLNLQHSLSWASFTGSTTPGVQPSLTLPSSLEEIGEGDRIIVVNVGSINSNIDQISEEQEHLADGRVDAP